MSPRVIQLIALVGAAAILYGSSRFIPKINEGRADLNMYGRENVQESLPPEYAFAIQAFGAFRGLITNIAFIRAEQYKMEGRYYDAMQLASWICKLQPRFPSVWEFQSWNMAWNISVTTYTPEERWNWVYNGAKLIRDEGIPYNPQAINLYRQLAWIFVNKMSEITDDYHLTYKKYWAWRMHLVLGPPPDPLGDYRPTEVFDFVSQPIGADRLADALRESVLMSDAAKGIERDLERTRPTGEPVRELSAGEIVRKSAYDYMDSIAAAPDTLEGLYAAHPATRPMVARLVGAGIPIADDRLTEEQYWRDEGLAFRFFYPYRMLTDPPSLLARVLEYGEESQDAARAALIDETLGVRSGNPDGLALVRFLQKKVLLQVYKLDPAKMAELVSIFGPIDWRVVDAHSLYWVNEGLIAGKETISKFGNDKVNTARLIFFSLRNLLQRNRLVFEPMGRDVNSAYINFNPDLNFIESMHQAYLTHGRTLDPQPTEKGVGGIYKTGHANFLNEAIRMLYFAGRVREAAEYYDYLRENYGMQADGKPNPAYALPLRDFVVNALAENIDGWRDIRGAIYGSFLNAFENLKNGNLPQFYTAWMLVEQLHTKYQSARGDLEKVALPSVPEMAADVLREWFSRPPIAPSVTLDKARLWMMLPNSLKLPIYDDMIDFLRRECALFPDDQFDVARAFPEPEGMEAYRKAHPGRGKQKPEDQFDVKTPAQQLN